MALAYEDEISAQIFEPSDGQELAVLSAEEMANTKGAMSLPEVNERKINYEKSSPNVDIFFYTTCS